VVARRRVDAHEGGAVLGEELERALDALVADPPPVAELDRDGVRCEAVEERRKLLELMAVGGERRRELEQERPELARLGERRIAFEADVRAALADADSSPITVRLVDSALLGHRPLI